MSKLPVSDDGRRPTGSGSLIRCGSCAATRLAGSTLRCRGCGDVSGEAIDATGPVVLHSFTQIHRSFPGFDTPFVLGWVDHPAGIRLLTGIPAISATSLEIGMPLELVDQGAGAEVDDLRIAYWCRLANSAASGAVG
jgi:uncharacterized OB-fold protein